MILNFDEQTSQFFQPASYNTKLLNHYNHDVYDKKTVCIDLTSELEQEHQYYDSNYGGRLVTSTNSNQVLNSTSDKEQPTSSSLSLHTQPKNYSSKKSKILLSQNNNNHEENKLNENIVTSNKMKKNQLKLNQTDLFVDSTSIKQASEKIHDNFFYSNNFHDVLGAKKTFNEFNKVMSNEKSHLKRHSSSMLYETNNYISPYIVSNSIVSNNSSVDKAKKICLEAINIKTSQQNSCNLFQTSMQDKDKHLIGKSTNTLCNCDCFLHVKKSEDHLINNNLPRLQLAHHMPSSPINSLSAFTSSTSFCFNNSNSAQSNFIPFKKRSFQQINDTSKNASDIATSDNALNINKKILSQSNSSLNRQKTVTNSYLLDSDLNCKKYSNETNSYSAGLTLPITIVKHNKPNDKPANKPLPITTAFNSSNSSFIKKDWSVSVVPFKKRNFSCFLDESSNLNTAAHVALSNRPEIVEKTFQKKSKEHLLDPNRQKKIKRCPHVWQFCADLLDDETYNPSIIKWLNKDRGIFKIVKPDKVADLWGAQKNRRSDKKMNYEKMARGMRYSRREGFFKKLDKEKNKPNEYGKQLVFQFSDKVVKNFDWKWSFSK